MEHQEPSSHMHPGRLASLADAIFAFAMTLLVLSITVPTSKDHIDVGMYFILQAKDFWTFALSFFLLGFFWLTYSQQYHHINKANSTTMLLNLLILLFVVLMPFSTSLMNNYPDDKIAEIFFNGNFFMLSFLLYVNWHYCLKKNFIDDQNKVHITRVSRTMTLLLFPPALALIVSFIYPGWSTLSYLFILIITLWPKKHIDEH